MGYFKSLKDYKKGSEDFQRLEATFKQHINDKYTSSSINLLLLRNDGTDWVDR